MKKHIAIILTAIIMIAASPAWAKTITVDVNGMVCDFCAQALNEVFAKEEKVQSIAVDLNANNVTIHMKDDNDLTDEEINKMIYWAGYDVASINRDEN